MKKTTSIGLIKPRPSYMRPKISPSADTSRVLKLANEINLINKQTQFIKDNGISAEEFRTFNQKKINIL